MALLILIRHGESQWNLENRFTGWVDVELSEKGKKEGYKIDKAYTSVLKRAVDTLDIAMKAAGRKLMLSSRSRELEAPVSAGKTGIPVTRSQALNERHYGALQGLNKAETAKKYSAEQVHIWRRSYDVPPPPDKTGFNPEGISESLKDTAARALPYFNSRVMKDLKEGQNVIVAAHGNSLRSIVMELDKMTKEQVLELNIPTAVPIVYEFDKNLKVLSKKIL